MYDHNVDAEHIPAFYFPGVKRGVARHNSTETKDDDDDDDGDDDFLFSNFLVHAFDPGVLRAGGGGMVMVVLVMVVTMLLPLTVLVVMVVVMVVLMVLFMEVTVSGQSNWVVGTVSGEGTGLQRFSGAIERV